MNKIQALIVYLGCIAILAINVPHALLERKRHAADQFDVGADALQVFTPETDFGTTVHAVRDVDGRPTGQSVRILLSWNYFDKQMHGSNSCLTISVVLILAIIYTMAVKSPRGARGQNG